MWLYDHCVTGTGSLKDWHDANIIYKIDIKHLIIGKNMPLQFMLFKLGNLLILPGLCPLLHQLLMSIFKCAKD